MENTFIDWSVESFAAGSIQLPDLHEELGSALILLR